MALPAILTGAYWQYWKNEKHGPFQVGDNLYAMLPSDVAVGYLMMFKSTDGGNTWSEMDAAGHPTYGSPISCAQLLGTSIYVAYNEATTFNTAIWVFDTTTDTWADNGVGSSVTTNSNDTGYWPITLAVRASGSYVVGYNGATRSYMGNQYRTVYLIRYSGGAWQTAQRVDGETTGVNADFRDMVGPDASGRCCLFYDKHNGSNVYWKVLKADNTLSTEANDVVQLGVTYYDVSGAILNGSEVVVLIHSTAPSVMVKRGTLGDTLSLSTYTVSDATPDSTNSNLLAASSNGRIFAFYVDNATKRIWWDQDSGSNTWGNDAVLFGADQYSTGGVATSSAATLKGTGYDMEELAQSFTLAVKRKIPSISVYLSKVNTSDYLYCDIVSSLGGTVIATSNAVDGNLQVLSGGSFVRFDFATPPDLNAGKYFLVLRRTVPNNTQYYWADVAIDNRYSGGGSWYKQSGTWYEITDYDWNFYVPALLSPRGISAGAVTGGIGVLFNDSLFGGRILYDRLKYPLSSPPPTPPKRIWRRRMTV